MFKVLLQTHKKMVWIVELLLTWGLGETSPRSLLEPRSRERRRIFMYIRLLDHDTESRESYALEASSVRTLTPHADQSPGRSTVMSLESQTF